MCWPLATAESAKSLVRCPTTLKPAPSPARRPRVRHSVAPPCPRPVRSARRRQRNLVRARAEPDAPLASPEQPCGLRQRSPGSCLVRLRVAADETREMRVGPLVAACCRQAAPGFSARAQSCATCAESRFDVRDSLIVSRLRTASLWSSLDALYATRSYTTTRCRTTPTQARQRAHRRASTRPGTDRRLASR